MDLKIQLRGLRETVLQKLTETEMPEHVRTFLVSEVNALSPGCNAVSVDAYGQQITGQKGGAQALRNWHVSVSGQVW